MKQIIKHIFVFALLIHCTKEFVPCPDNRQPCEWYDWGVWSPCSEVCGGGRQARTRGICCDEIHKNDSDKCVVDCGFVHIDIYMFQECNNICYNGGYYDGYYCVCIPPYSGTCCEKGPPTTTSSKAPTTVSPTTSVQVTSTTEKTTKVAASGITAKVGTSKPKTGSPTSEGTSVQKTKMSTSGPTTVSSATASTSKSTKKMSMSRSSTASPSPKGTLDPTTTDTVINQADGSMKYKQSCNSEDYKDCNCVISKKKIKTRSILKDVQFSGYGAILGLLFSIGTYILWNYCGERKSKQNGIKPLSRRISLIDPPIGSIDT